ncbi:MAG: hypothetical protein HRT67_02120 [Flavobacteriaceae bacterium]|nr:hypothetical protein [Flavobacteriaceae bacterium]
MAKLYSNRSRYLDTLNPKEGTVKFLLEYSQALSVINYDKLKFEILLN